MCYVNSDTDFNLNPMSASKIRISGISAHVPESVRDIAEAILQCGGRAYLVGGWVRDALLGHPVDDADLEVYQIHWEALKSCLGNRFPFDHVGEAFGILKIRGANIDVALPRCERKRGFGHRGFEVQTDPDLPMEIAAARRDFRINAIYYDPVLDLVIDPLGGMKDLFDRRLRHCGPDFRDDPLRVLRAMQIAARFDLTVDKETIRLCSTVEWEGLAAERIYPEWRKLVLLGEKPSTGLKFLRECGWLGYFPELEALVECPQDPVWHPEGDVWEHTLHCMDAFARDRIGDPVEDVIVGFAVLCHDFGKPATTSFQDGRWRSHGHERRGVPECERFLQRLGMPKKLVKEILPLVEAHMRPGQLHAANAGMSAVRKLANKVGRLDRLLRVFLADDAGRPPIAAQGRLTVEWLSEMARKEEILAARPEPILKGRHLIDRGFQPGPRMGEILREASKVQIQEGWKSVNEAVAWLHDRLGESEK